jgi:hypothetical protein
MIFPLLPQTEQLVAKLLYGTGTRLVEGLSLRVKDVDFDRGSMIVREGKGGKHRVVMLLRSLEADLRGQHHDDLHICAKGRGWRNGEPRWMPSACPGVVIHNRGPAGSFYLIGMPKSTDLLVHVAELLVHVRRFTHLSRSIVRRSVMQSSYRSRVLRTVGSLKRCDGAVSE